MKFYRLFVCMALTMMSAMFMTGCVEDSGVDNRETDYGYVQFKLYKAASYIPEAQGEPKARAQVVDRLDWLAQAYKIRVSLRGANGRDIALTLNLNSAGTELAEWGLRSDKVKLLEGQYTINNFTLYDAYDEVRYVGVPAEEFKTMEVEVGTLCTHDLTVNVVPRGQVRFSLVKDMSSMPDTAGTRAADREYTFDEIKEVDITVRHTLTNREVTFSKIPMEFSLEFKDGVDTPNGHRTSILESDSVMWLEAGEYRIVRYVAYDEYDASIDVNSTQATFKVDDNELVDVEVPINVYGGAEYIKDYMALYEIWKSLNGPDWYYVGENFTRGANWNFDKDIDLWGDQPGVKLHSNGRVAFIDISDFGFSGAMSPAIGQLTELMELYLGTHNDANMITYDPEEAKTHNQSLAYRTRNRMEIHKEYLRKLHPATQMSEPCARALMEHNISVPEISLYESMKENEIIEPSTGHQRVIRPMDTNHGTLCNGLTSLPAEIGNLENLQYLNIANSTIAELPEELSKCYALTDLEIYNCPNMKKFPAMIAKLPSLVALNLSNNKQWTAEDIYNGFDAIAKGPSQKSIQLVYARENSLEELPASLSNMHSLSLLDLAYNKIRKMHPFGKNVGLVQLYLDYNELESLPRFDENGEEVGFCAIDDVDTFSVKYNKLKKVPNIFSATSKFTMSSVDFSGNQIDGFEDEEKSGKDGYKGIRVETLTLSQNKFKEYPTAIAKTNSLVSYIILRANEIRSIPDEALSYKNSVDLVSFDLSYNRLSKLPKMFHAGNFPYLYGMDLSFNAFSEFPFEPLDAGSLTVYAIRSQRNDKGERCLRKWPTGLYNHKGLRGFYIGSNDLRRVDDTISTLIYYLDISDNPRIVFDASDICYAWQVGAYYLIYDKTQNIQNCEYMLE